MTGRISKAMVCTIAWWRPQFLVLSATRKSAGERDDAVTLSNTALDMIKNVQEMFITREKSLPIL